MSARSSLFAAIAITAITLPGQAQVVSSSPLEQVDPWAIGWLGQADGALPADIWENSSATSLGPLMSEIDPGSLSPAARTALNRVILSSARAPEEGDALTPARLRLLERLGHQAHADQLRTAFPSKDWAQGAATNTAGFAILDGRARATCADISQGRADNLDLIAVRALCYAIAEDYDAAALLGEQAAQMGIEEAPWLLSVIEYMRTPTGNGPTARFDTPFEIATSMAASLAPRSNSDLENVTPDIARAILRHPNATTAQKSAVLNVALDNNRLQSADAIAIITSIINDADSNAKLGALERAVQLYADDTAPPADKAEAYSKALNAANNAQTFRSVAITLSDPIAALPATTEFASNAELFTRALITAGDRSKAGEWRALLTPADDNSNTWSLARLDAALILAGNDLPAAAEIADRLIANSLLADEATPPSGRTARQAAEAQATETARILFLFVGTGRSLSPAARSVLPSLKSAGRGISDPAIMRIIAAQNAEAKGEAMLSAIALIQRDPAEQSYIGLSDVLAQLRQTGLQTDVDAIALEALQLWKTF